MAQSAVIKLCKGFGCCDGCCLRYIGVKNPNAYEKSHEFIQQYLEGETNSSTSEHPNTTENDQTESKININIVQDDTKSAENSTKVPENSTEGQEDSKIGIKQDTDKSESTRVAEVINGNGSSSPPAKRKKSEICLSCVGILQENTWLPTLEMVKEQLDKKKYDCQRFACALSAPIATLLREKAITLNLKDSVPEYDPNCLTALKEAWKWSFGIKLESYIGKTLESGASCPLLITVAMEYPDDSTELEIVKQLAPSLFQTRRQQRKRFAVEMTRRAVDQALDGVSLAALQRLCWRPAPAVAATAHCASVVCAHAPGYIAGRYIKLSRELPQTPWMVSGKRMMESSVQETIFEPLAKLLQMSVEEMECHLKFMSAGREDVDVRCLGDGRPFAIEVADPKRQLTSQELQTACEEISKGGKVIVKEMVYVTKEDLTLLKKGEETKTKTYEALCIKLTHTKDDPDTEGPPIVTDTDISNINSYKNTDSPDARVVLQQKTPIRVLHRRPLLTRTRKILDLEAKKVTGEKHYTSCGRKAIIVLVDLDGLGFASAIQYHADENCLIVGLNNHPQLFWVRLVTEAGTYVKEWAHGDLGRTSPSLSSAVGARTDILALDVSAVDLPWPHTNKS